MKKIILFLALLTGIKINAQIVGGAITPGSTSTLSNKTLVSPTITGSPNLKGTLTGTGAINTTGAITTTGVVTGGSFVTAGTSGVGSNFSVTGTSFLGSSVGIGAMPISSLVLASVMKGTARIDLGQVSAGNAGMWLLPSTSTANTTNYNFMQSGSDFLINNSGTNIYFQTAGGVSRGVWNATGLRVGSSSSASATLDVAGTMNVSSTSSLNGITNTGNVFTGAGYFSGAFFSINNGDASMRANGTYGLRFLGYNVISGAEEEKFAYKSNRASTGANYSFSFTPTSFTNQTASTEAPAFVIGTATVGHATGAISGARDFYQSTITHSAVGASTLINMIGAEFAAATAGSNVTLVNPLALHSKGDFSVTGNTFISGTETLGSATLTGGNTGTVAVLSDAVFAVTFQHGSYSPGDAATLYYGQNSSGTPQTSATFGRIYAQNNITLIGYDYQLLISGTAGSNETATLSVRVDNTTDVALNSAVQYSFATGLNDYHSSALSTDINSGSYFNLKWVTPTWVTNPTSLFESVTLWFRRRT